jgi:hypothetical protein
MSLRQLRARLDRLEQRIPNSASSLTTDEKDGHGRRNLVTSGGGGR